MKKFKCINNNDGQFSLTVGKEYEISNLTEKWVFLTNDKNKESRYSIGFFEEVQDNFNFSAEVEGSTLKVYSDDNELLSAEHIAIPDFIFNHLSCCLMDEVTNAHLVFYNIYNKVKAIVNDLIKNKKNVITDINQIIDNCSKELFLNHIKSSTFTRNIIIFALVNQQDNYQLIRDVINEFPLESEAISIHNNNSGNSIDVILINRADIQDNS